MRPIVETNSIKIDHMLWMSCIWNHHVWVRLCVCSSTVMTTTFCVKAHGFSQSWHTGLSCHWANRPTVMWRGVWYFIYLFWQQVCKSQIFFIGLNFSNKSHRVAVKLSKRCKTNRAECSCSLRGECCAGWRRNSSLANTSEKLERVNWFNSFIRCVLVSGELTKAGGMNEYVIGAELSRVWARLCVCRQGGESFSHMC